MRDLHRSKRHRPIISDFENLGFSTLEGFFPDEIIAKAISELNQILGDLNKHQGIIFEKDGKTPRSIANPHLKSEFFRKLVRYPKILNLVQEILGEDIYVFQLGINLKAPFSGDVWPWHQDFPTHHFDDHVPEGRMVNVLVYLDDINEFNGPLMMIPGSNKLLLNQTKTTYKGTSHAIRYANDQIVADQIKSSGIKMPLGSAGLTILMDVNTIHGSGANLSPWPRRLMTITYNAFSNKAVQPSSRSSEIVYSDSNLPPIKPFHGALL